MISDDLCRLIEVMIQDYESYNERNASCIVASPEIVRYLLANTLSGVTLDARGKYAIAGVELVSDPNINRGKIEIL